jgi:midasin
MLCKRLQSMHVCSHHLVRINCRPQDQEGFVRPEAPEPEFELPDNLNLDGEDGGEQGADEHQEEVGDPDISMHQETQPDGDEKEQQQQQDDDEREGIEGDDRDETMQLGSGDAGEGMKEEEEAKVEQPEGDGTAADGAEETPPEDSPGTFAQQQDLQEHQAQQDAPEAGQRGLPSVAVRAAGLEESMAAGDVADGMDVDGAEADLAASKAQTAPIKQSQHKDGSASGGTDGQQGAETAARSGGQPGEGERRADSQQQSEPNPYRHLGDAMERWKARLAVTQERPQQDSEDQRETEVAAPEDAAMEEQEQGESGLLRDGCITVQKSIYRCGSLSSWTVAHRSWFCF